MSVPDFSRGIPASTVRRWAGWGLLAGVVLGAAGTAVVLALG